MSKVTITIEDIEDKISVKANVEGAPGDAPTLAIIVARDMLDFIRSHSEPIGEGDANANPN